MQTTDYTVDQVPELFRSLREKIRRETSPEAGASVARQLELPLTEGGAHD